MIAVKNNKQTHYGIKISRHVGYRSESVLLLVDL